MKLYFVWIHIALFYLVIYFCILILDSKPSLVNKANLQWWGCHSLC